VKATVEVDGKRFFKGKVSCVLDDGRLELGVVTAKNPVEWARTFGRLALGRAEESPLAWCARRVIELYEDGHDRFRARRSGQGLQFR
jgi:diacylglycerol kinase (ATP)